MLLRFQRIFTKIGCKLNDKITAGKKFILWLTAVLMLFSAIPAQAGNGRLVTQNWAGSAVFYDAPCDETESFHMTDDEFLCNRLSLENRLIYAYSAYLNSLDGDERRRSSLPRRRG